MKNALLTSILIFGFAASTLAQADTRKVDFKNFTYKLSCGSADKVSPVPVKNGEYSGDKDSIGDRVYLKITDVIFGDINGD